jgi:ubiquinone/menaquinone biosynthesis C-methylase UbiE
MIHIINYISIQAVLQEGILKDGAEEIIMEKQVANVHKLPFEDDSFDAICMIAVIGEIPEPERALSEF